MKLEFIWFFITYLIVAVSGNSVSSASQFTPFNSPDFCSQIITPSCNTTFSFIDAINSQIRQPLANLVKTAYFRHFKLDFEKQCKFWNAQHFCATENCAVEILSPDQYNWTEVTEDLKPEKLGKIDLKNGESEDHVCEDLDYTHIDEGNQCVYVNLVENPERFTGYGGEQAHNVWRAIYSENCFPNTTEQASDETCVEKNLFYRLISGMHASISVHLANEYLDADTGDFYPDLRVFMERVGTFNDRLSNIYFNYALVSQSLVRLSELLSLKDIISNDEAIDPHAQQAKFIANDAAFEDQTYEELLDEIIPVISSNPLFNTSSLFNPSSIPEDIKMEFRSRFRNISAIMDCVGCDRCRMWGKLQTIGYGTALKILFESEDPQNSEKLRFRRIEIVALVNTFDRLSKSVQSINSFKNMYIEHLENVRKGLVKPGDYDKRDDKNGLKFPFFKVPDAVKTASESTKPADTSSTKRSMPTKKVVSPREKKILQDRNSRTFYDEFKIAFDDVYQALLFVLGSYRDFPVTVFKISMVYLNEGWNVLIGKPKKYAYHSELSVEEGGYENILG